MHRKTSSQKAAVFLFYKVSWLNQGGSLKPRKSRGISMALAIMMLCAVPASTRAYIPYVQPHAAKPPLPRAKQVKYIPVKKIRGYGTGYFGPKRKDYQTEEEYQSAVRMNGKGVITSSGTKPQIGTIAADTKHYPYGTVIFIPEINFTGKVEDTGEAVVGKRHVDIFCGHGKRARKIALTWGNGTKITLVIMKKILI